MKKRDAAPETVRAALDCIPPDGGHGERVRLAFAVFDALGAAGGDLWLEWAGRRENANAIEDRATWRSIKPGKVKAGTLFAEAKKHGFKWPEAQAPAPKLTQAELKARVAARREAELRERAATAQRQAEAAAEALRLWESAADVTDPAAVPYLARKGIKPYGVRALPDGTLLVPARDTGGELVNVQRILPTRGTYGTDKLFVKGGRKAGTRHCIGCPADGAGVCAWLLIAEGYATAASLHEATGRPVAVAWDAGNLAHAVRELQGKYPAARLALCADDDRATEARTGKNPGRDKARDAAQLAGKGRGLVILPPMGPDGLPADGSGGTDFNDLHALRGLSAVRAAVESALQAAETAVEASEGAGPTLRSSGAPDPFRVDESGTWYTRPGTDAEGKEYRPHRLCDPLHVTGRGRDKHGNGWCLLLEFDTPDGVRQWPMPLSMLAGDGSAYRAELLDKGFMVPIDADTRAKLTKYLQSRQGAELVRLVDRVGWHDRSGARPVYVLPRETLGTGDGERVQFHSDAPTESAFAQRGTLADWQTKIAHHCIGNPRLAFAVMLAFAGPVLAWAPVVDGGGFHYVGDSSCGKTTALRTGASVWGAAGGSGATEYLQRWRATDNGLEAMAAQHSDCTAFLDELAQLDAAKAGEAAYMLANGQGKSRAGRTGAARPRQTWRLLFASAGETGLADHMTEAGKRTKAGQELRMIDLPADAGKGLGLFDDASGFETPGALADHLKAAAAKHYGTAGRAWLQWLTENTEGLARRLSALLETAERDFVPEAASGQVQRVGKRFALVAAAGELATQAGITAWPEGTARAAARACFNAWLTARPAGIGQSEDAQGLRQVRGWFGLNGDGRFARWGVEDNDNKPRVLLRAGWRKPLPEDSGKGMVPEAAECEWYVLPDVFRDEVCKSLNARAVLALLKRLGHLHTEPQREGFTCSATIAGHGRVQVYRIKSSLLGQSDDLAD